MNKEASFINAPEAHREHPKTFQIPNQEKLAFIQPGDYVKVGVRFPDAGFLGGVNFGGERFWVKVASVTGETIAGQVEQADMLFHTQHGVNHDDNLCSRRRTSSMSVVSDNSENENNFEILAPRMAGLGKNLRCPER